MNIKDQLRFASGNYDIFIPGTVKPTWQLLFIFYQNYPPKASIFFQSKI